MTYLRHRSKLLTCLTGMAAVAGSLAAVAPSAPAAPKPSGQVLDGHARFEVLSPTLIRLEYAGDNRFQDGPTFNVQNRDFPVPAYSTDVENGYRVIRTGALTLRYKENSGPFTPANTTVNLTVAGKQVTAQPIWSNPPCVPGQLCEAEAATLSGGAGKASDHTGYTGQGFVPLSTAGQAIDWSVDGVSTAGDYSLAIRYANSYGAIGGGTHTLSLSVDGQPATTVSLPMTASWNDWATVTQPLHLSAGDHDIKLSCASGDSCNVNVDSMAVTAPGAVMPAPQPPVAHNPLGGWYRDLGGQSGPVALNPGLLSRDGWSLLDDTRTALWTPGGWPQARPNHPGGYQDGYFFGYGHDYKLGLRELATLVGPSPLLPRQAFGVWYSRYYPYSTSDYEQQLIPAFRSHQVPLDVLVVDTDWKSPNQWNGWNWNSKLFPDPQAFLSWAHQQGLLVTMNIHAGIQDNDPRFAQAQAIAQGGLMNNGSGKFWDPASTEYTFDWSNPNDAAAYFWLHQPFEQQGVDFWWLDYFGSGESTASTPGLSPDAWINQLYSQRLTSRGRRGFSFARMGGQWGERRTTVAFTGDTNPTWGMLAFEAQFTPDEGAALGLPYVTDDIGSFAGNHLADDLYARWVQLGTFQPILRLHSDHGDRLPWNYPGAAETAAEKFLRLRESLVPYSYTLAEQARQTGVPMTEPLYLDYPEQDAAYSNPDEYLYGDNVLVAPVTTPGRTADTMVWFPPGTWTDYFTGQVFTGPSSHTVATDWNQMPVFVKGGGIIPERSSYVDHDGQKPGAPLALDVYPQGDSTFSLYEDAGSGQGYQHGQSATTAITSTAPKQGSGTVSVTIGAAHGSYPGQANSRGYQVALHTDSAPSTVFLGKQKLPEVTAQGFGSTPGWYYDAAQGVIHVATPSVSVRTPVTVTVHGTSAVGGTHPGDDRAELSLDAPAVLAPGQPGHVTATLHNATGRTIDPTVQLSLPAGWVAQPARQATGPVAPGTSASAEFTVTPPPGTQPGSYVLTADASYTTRGQPHQLSTVASSVVPYGSLAAVFDNVGVTDDSAIGAGNLDGYHDSYSAQALAAAGVTPGAKVTSAGLTYTWPDAPPGSNDNATAAGQSIALSGTGTTLGLLGAAVSGPSTGTATVTYTDGSTQTAKFTLDDWTLNGGRNTPVNPIAVSTAYRNCANCGGAQPLRTDLFSATIPLQSGKTPAMVTLPGDANPGSMHLFALTVGTP